MPLVFKTFPDSPDRAEIVGVGVLFPHGKGGVVVADAAAVMPELQEKNPDGTLKLNDEGNPTPLTGSKLTNAAKAFAEERGFTTQNVAEADIENLAAETGVAPDRPPMHECGAEDYARTYGNEPVTVNADPEELVNPSPGAGVPVAPDTPQQED